MGDHLTLSQVTEALKQRGLNITALESMDKQDFRQLLDGVQFQNSQLNGVVAAAQVSMDQIKDNIAASYDAAQFSLTADQMQTWRKNLGQKYEKPRKVVRGFPRID